MQPAVSRTAPHTASTAWIHPALLLLVTLAMVSLSESWTGGAFLGVAVSMVDIIGWLEATVPFEARSQLERRDLLGVVGFGVLAYGAGTLALPVSEDSVGVSWAAADGERLAKYMPPEGAEKVQVGPPVLGRLDGQLLSQVSDGDKLHGLMAWQVSGPAGPRIVVAWKCMHLELAPEPGTVSETSSKGIGGVMGGTANLDRVTLPKGTPLVWPDGTEAGVLNSNASVDPSRWSRDGAPRRMVCGTGRGIPWRVCVYR